MARIVVAEDDRTVQSLLVVFLSEEGHVVLPFLDGKAALDHLKDLKNPLPDVIISDVMMPRMDGYTFHAALLQDERTKGIPFVVITSKGALEPSFQASPNFAGFAEKPFDLLKLRQTIAKAVAKGSPPR